MADVAHATYAAFHSPEDLGRMFAPPPPVPVMGPDGVPWWLEPQGEG